MEKIQGTKGDILTYFNLFICKVPVFPGQAHLLGLLEKAITYHPISANLLWGEQKMNMH
jgi:hypothetical protein